MGPTSKERRLEILQYAQIHGTKDASFVFGVSEETIKRYRRASKDINTLPAGNQLITEVRDQFTDKELRTLLKSGYNIQRELKKPIPKFNGKRFKIGSCSDIHTGSIYTDYKLVDLMWKEFDKENVDFITVCGDVTEGMSNRQGHVFECSEIGYNNQLTKAVELFSGTAKPVYMIDGNHDQWYIKANGALIVNELCNRLKHCTFLGHDEGSIDLGGAELRLWHGGDGNSYALSYRVQKVIESLTGGDKPNVMFFGHTHKSLYIYERMVHCYSMGAIQKQSKWMRTKRLQSHTGFWIIDIYVNKQGISKTTGTFYPFYQ